MLDALHVLADEYECDVASINTKIKNLLTAFRREHNSRTRTKSGSSPIKKISGLGTIHFYSLWTSKLLGLDIHLK